MEITAVSLRVDSCNKRKRAFTLVYRDDFCCDFLLSGGVKAGVHYLVMGLHYSSGAF